MSIRKKLVDLTFDTDVAPVAEGEEVNYTGSACPARIDGKPTVNGKPLPEGFEFAIPYANTDQGIWEKNQRPGVRKGSGIKVGREPLDKAMDQRLDQPWAQVDPLKAAVDRVAEPGFKYRALSERVCDKRGTRGWEPVVDQDGDQVKVGRLFLGRMPEEAAAERNEHYRKIGSEDLKDLEENLTLDQERAIRDSGSRGVSTLRRGETLTDSRDPSRVASVGFEQTRGE